MVKVGWVHHAHGLLGEFYVHLYNFPPNWLDENKLESLVLRSPDGSKKLDFSVKRVRLHKRGLIFHCSGISDRNEAEVFKGYSMEISRSYLVGQKEGEMYLNEVLGFEVFVEGRGVVGEIKAFKSHPSQDNLVVQGSTHVYEIPFVDDYTIKICFESSQVHMRLPEGLLELYESE